MVWELRVFVAAAAPQREVEVEEEEKEEKEAKEGGQQRRGEAQALPVLDERDEGDVKMMLASPRLANVGTQADHGSVERRSDTYLVTSPCTGLKFRGGKWKRVEVKQRLAVNDSGHDGAEMWTKRKENVRRLAHVLAEAGDADMRRAVTVHKARDSAVHPREAGVIVEHAVLTADVHNLQSTTNPPASHKRCGRHVCDDDDDEAADGDDKLASWLARLKALATASDAAEDSRVQWHSVSFESSDRDALRRVRCQLEPLARRLMTNQDGEGEVAADARPAMVVVHGGYPTWVRHVASTKQ